jgi:type I restriction enzyme M protein
LAQLEHIEMIEKRLWSAADTMRANSNYASNEYFLPVMGLIFLRHAYSRFLVVKKQVEADLPRRGGKRRAWRRINQLYWTGNTWACRSVSSFPRKLYC